MNFSFRVEDQPGSNNYFLASGTNRIYIVDDPDYRSNVRRRLSYGRWSTTLRWLIESKRWEYAHEAGHLMGLADRYYDWPRRQRPHSGWEGNIMAEWWGRADKRNISEILSSGTLWGDFIDCPCECNESSTPSQEATFWGTTLKDRLEQADSK